MASWPVSTPIQGNDGAHGLPGRVKGVNLLELGVGNLPPYLLNGFFLLFFKLFIFFDKRLNVIEQIRP